MWKSVGHAPSLRVFTLAFALQLKKKHGKTTVRVRETSVRLIKTSVKGIHNTKTPTHYKTDTNTHTHTHTHTLQNNIKPPQYKLKQTKYKIYPMKYNNTHKITTTIQTTKSTTITHKTT
jgi:hypothetical protein